MGELLINSKFIKKNKELKKNQKQYLKTHKTVKGKYPKAKLGKIFVNEAMTMKECIANSKVQDRMRVPESAEELIQLTDDIGLKGLSGSGFNTAEKFKTVNNSKATTKYFIINAVSCDPGLVHDAWILKNFSDRINEMAKIISKCLGISKTIIASPENVPAKYPMGAEKILIKQLFNIELDCDAIPAVEGILVINVQTVLSLYNVINGLDIIDNKYITVANLDTGKAVVAKVTTGSNAYNIVNRSGFTVTASTKVFCGMGVMEAIEVNKDYNITVQDNFITVAEKTAVFNDNAKCAGCGKCVNQCPMHVNVRAIIKNPSDNNTASQCIGCGTCSYFCGAGKNTMKFVKASIR